MAGARHPYLSSDLRKRSMSPANCCACSRWPSGQACFPWYGGRSPFVTAGQYWNWKEVGIESSPGSTIVYDQMAPVYLPDQERDFESFMELRDRIRNSVFDPTVLQARDEFHRFWQQLESGEGRGVLS